MSQKKQPALTAESVRAHLRETVEELNRLDEKRAALQAMIRGHEAWLGMFADRESEAARTAPGERDEGEGDR